MTTVILAGLAPGFAEESTDDSTYYARVGYPPAHHTPTLDKNSWRYWRSKFDTVLLYFEDDVLDRIQD